MATKSSNVTAHAAQTPVASQQQARENVLRPAVDVYEDADGITLEADMPGVSRDRLDVRVEGETLLVEGRLQFDLPEQAEALHADVRSTAFRRTFLLSRELDTDKIQANLKDGVLRVQIPKRAEMRPRKIDVLSS